MLIASTHSKAVRFSVWSERGTRILPLQGSLTASVVKEGGGCWLGLAFHFGP